jgi:beta-glucanase (GH16 family)
MLKRWFGRRLRAAALCGLSLAGVTVVRDPGDKPPPAPVETVAEPGKQVEVGQLPEGKVANVPEKTTTVPPTTAAPTTAAPTTAAPKPVVTAPPATEAPAATPDPPSAVPNGLPADLQGRSWNVRDLGRSDVSLGVMPTWTVNGVRMDHFGNEQQRYRDSNVVWGSDGLIRLIGRSNDWANSDTGYTSGAFTTGWLENQLRVGRGAYVQAAMKLPEGPGTWPALWLVDAPHTPDRGQTHEVDIMEAVGSWTGRVFHTTHFMGQERQIMTPLDPTQWHTYGVYLADDGTHFYVDGVHVGSHPAVPAGMRYGVMANLAIGGDWPGAPSPGAYPAEVVMTPVRIWTPA